VPCVGAAEGDDEARGEEEGEGLQGAPGGGCEGVEGEGLRWCQLSVMFMLSGCEGWFGRGRTSEDAMVCRLLDYTGYEDRLRCGIDLRLAGGECLLVF
jgi:hypothetical protein